ncbi:site-2 protease family protein (plasmid) [Cupriavidus pinatubonensis]|uniref:site-2 protease family protein n=1 Tax=Cupriavidus pinatubonensis TaxID=248026 RepID=UPI001C73559F|nr:site-2 protease family protein [Cupriavidus pinatubonensis]QYY33710.1 site-2 protease family protein [Cupriavidus pinatubonensis]
MLKKYRTYFVELPLGLVLVCGFIYLHVTPENYVEMFLTFALALGVLGIVETIIHEGGHILCGLWYGVPLYKLQIGFGPVVLSREIRGVPVVACKFPFGGRVDFQYLPISRPQRIVMYAGGVGASIIGATVIWLLIPARLEWLGTEVVMAFAVFNLVNIFGTAPEGAASDGSAIRGLLSYRAAPSSEPHSGQ